MFAVWLLNNKDMAKRSFMKRRQLMRTTAETVYAWMKLRDIISQVFAGDEVKGKKLAEFKRAKGRWMQDKDFPDDEEERYYWCKKAAPLQCRRSRRRATRLR